MGAFWRMTSRICSSAQLSFPPDSPTMMRSPDSIIEKSVTALVVFFAMRASSSERYPMQTILLSLGADRDRRSEHLQQSDAIEHILEPGGEVSGADSAMKPRRHHVLAVH